jgi:uncharacterized protein
MSAIVGTTRTTEHDVICSEDSQECGAVRILSTLLKVPITMAFTFGEERGWRGFLLPSLLPLGQWKALFLHGAMWELCHAPAVLLGLNYPLQPRTGVFLMTVFCSLTGVLLGYLRSRSGNIWPVVMAHAAINSSAALLFLFGSAKPPVDFAQVGLLGWSGWILLSELILVLKSTKCLPVLSAEPNEF